MLPPRGRQPINAPWSRSDCRIGSLSVNSNDIVLFWSGIVRSDYKSCTAFFYSINKHVCNFVSRVSVERPRRFVRNYKQRIFDYYTRYRYSLLLTARKLIDLSPLQFSDTRFAQYFVDIFSASPANSLSLRKQRERRIFSSVVPSYANAVPSRTVNAENTAEKITMTKISAVNNFLLNVNFIIDLVRYAIIYP